MTNIRVDPSELAKVAEGLASAAENLRAQAEEVASVAANAPEYDGQFGPKVRGLALEAQSPVLAQAQRLTEMSEQLLAIAEAFALADQEGMAAFEGLAELIRQGKPETLLQAMLGMSPDRYAHLLADGAERGALEEPEEDDEQDLLDRLADLVVDQFTDLGLHWQLITDKDAAAWLRKIHGLPTAVLRVRGWDEAAGTFVRYIDTDLAIRSFGRLIGDAAAPPLFLIGWGLTLAPEQYENIKKGAEWNEFVGDAIVDTGGFAAGEASGWLATGLTSATGPGAIAAKLVADIGAGAVYDLAAEHYNWRGQVSEWVGGLPGEVAAWYSSTTEGYANWFAVAIDEALDRETIRIPMPQVEPIRTSTLTPGPAFTDPLPTPGGQVPVAATPTPSPTETAPPLSPTPLPPEE